jgi:ferredoxin
MAPGQHILLYEGTGSRPLDPEKRFLILTGLLDLGYSVSRTGTGACLPAGESSLLVLGEFAGAAAPELSDTAGRVTLTTRDITPLDAAGVVALVESARNGRPMNQPGQCSAGKIQVQNNENCKTNCPACSRVCPEVAIMFPKYTAGPINGEPVRESDLKREAMKIDISALLGGDIYSRLRQRSDDAKARFSKERDAGKALAERKKCLTKLAGDGLIPPEVLASLPSPDEIARKAAEAAAKAQAALALQS